MDLVKTFTQFQQLVSHITYKPGYTFELIGDANFVNIATLRVRAYVQDVRDPSKTIELNSFMAIDLFNDIPERLMLDLVDNHVRNLEMHEVDEWLKYNGICVHEPKHYPGETH